MSRISKNSLSVRQLVDLLDHPQSKTLPKKAEIVIDRDELKKQMRLKWKDPGYCNIEFNKTPGIRAKILNQWQQQRIYLATRSYVTPKNVKPYQFDKQSREFPRVSLKAYSQKFQSHLKKIENQNQDLLFKEKRTVTEGIGYTSTRGSHQSGSITFKPTHTSSNLFGFSGLKSFSSKTKNEHMKTHNV